MNEEKTFTTEFLINFRHYKYSFIYKDNKPTEYISVFIIITEETTHVNFLTLVLSDDLYFSFDFFLLECKLEDAVIFQVALVVLVLDDSLTSVFLVMLAQEGQVVKDVPFDSTKINKFSASAFLVAIEYSILWKAFFAEKCLTSLAFLWILCYTAAQETNKILEKIFCVHEFTSIIKF